jgi:hypothetical protein
MSLIIDDKTVNLELKVGEEEHVKYAKVPGRNKSSKEWFDASINALYNPGSTEFKSECYLTWALNAHGFKNYKVTSVKLENGVLIGELDLTFNIGSKGRCNVVIYPEEFIIYNIEKFV